MQRRRLAATDLHFAFGHLRGVSGLTLVANGTRAPLSSHTEPSRAALKREGGLWAVVDLSKLTHYVSGVELPADRGVLVSVQGERENREVVRILLEETGRDESLVKKIPDPRRGAHDKRYSMSTAKFAALGWKPTHPFEQSLRETVRWYKERQDWWRPLVATEDFQSFVARFYGPTLGEDA